MQNVLAWHWTHWPLVMTYPSEQVHTEEPAVECELAGHGTATDDPGTHDEFAGHCWATPPTQNEPDWQVLAVPFTQLLPIGQALHSQPLRSAEGFVT